MRRIPTLSPCPFPTKTFLSAFLLSLSWVGIAQGSQLLEASEYADLERIAQASISANIRTLTTGKYLSAGSNQFMGLWTRDFSFASRGLNWIGRTDVTHDHLTRILSMVREDGLVPRYMDNRTTADRYGNLIIGKRPGVREPLVANYHSGGTNPNAVIDSNSLVLLAALDYVKTTQDHEWWAKNEAVLVKVFKNHQKYIDEGLIEQGKAADWQDSAERVGKTFYTNLLYWAVLDRLADREAFGVSAAQADALKSKIIDRFYDARTGLYFSVAGHPQISLDGLLLAIDLGFHPVGSAEAKFLYESLKVHPLWTKNPGLPGYVTYPDYPVDSIEAMPKLVGVRHYHDRIYWSWLIGLSAKVAYLMGDFEAGDKILDNLQAMAVRDGAIAEVFRWDPPFRIFQTTFYMAEKPFSWGAGMILDAVYSRKALLQRAPVSAQEQSVEGL